MKELGRYRLSCKRVSEKKFRTWDYFATAEQAQSKGNQLVEKKWITAYRVVFKGKTISEG